MSILQAIRGKYINGKWQPLRIWNGDHTDCDLNRKHGSEVVHISFASSNNLFKVPYLISQSHREEKRLDTSVVAETFYVDTL